MIKKFTFYILLIIFVAVAWYIVSPKWYFHKEWKFNKITGKVYRAEKPFRRGFTEPPQADEDVPNLFKDILIKEQ